MAEIKKLKARRTVAYQRLNTTLVNLENAIVEDNGRTPTEQALTRQQAGLGTAWGAYDAAHGNYCEVLEEEVAEAEAGGFQTIFDRYNLVVGKVEDMVAKRQGLNLDSDTLYNDAKVKRTRAFVKATALAKNVHDYFAREGDKVECKEGLEAKGKLLDQAEGLLREAAEHTDEMKRRKPEAAVADEAERARQEMEVEQKILKCRDTITALMASVAGPAGGAGGGGRPSQDHYFKRWDLPKFDGQRRNYPSFKREWVDSVTGKYDPNHEVRQLKLNVPKEVEPELKNLHEMREVWGVLDKKYGSTLELSTELVTGLQDFKFSSAARTEPAKLKELHMEFIKVLSDLKQVGELAALDHKPTLRRVAMMLPSADSQKNYNRMRRELMARNTAERAVENSTVAVISELDIMIKFMEAERELQDDFAQLNLKAEVKRDRNSDGGGNSGVPSNRERGGAKTWGNCFRCDQPGHKAVDCEEQGSSWSNASAHANMRLRPKDCPVCNGQHTCTGQGGELLYRTRLSSCEEFRAYGVIERGSIIEQAGGCSLCLDWTGSHTRDNCREKLGGELFGNCQQLVDGEPCGRKHNSMLHGATTKYCNFNWMNRAMGESQEVLADQGVENAEQNPRVMQSFIRGEIHVAAKVERVPDEANKCKVEKEVLALSKIAEEQREGTSVNAEADQVNQLDIKEEELERLLKATAERLEDALAQVEDVEQTRIEFYEILDKLNVLEDLERSGGKKEKELGVLSIKRFKRISMQRFGDAIVDFKAQVKRAKAKEVVEAEQKANLLEVESEEEAQHTFVQPCESEPEEQEQETMVESCVMELKQEEEKVQDNMVGQDELKHEEEECQRAAFKVDTRSHTAGGWSLKVAKEMFRQIEAEKCLLPRVKPVDQWKSEVKSSEGSWEAKVAELRLEPG